MKQEKKTIQSNLDTITKEQEMALAQEAGQAAGRPKTGESATALRNKLDQSLREIASLKEDTRKREMKFQTSDRMRKYVH